MMPPVFGNWCQAVSPIRCNPMPLIRRVKSVSCAPNPPSSPGRTHEPPRSTRNRTFLLLWPYYCPGLEIRTPDRISLSWASTCRIRRRTWFRLRAQPEVHRRPRWEMPAQAKAPPEEQEEDLAELHQPGVADCAFIICCAMVRPAPSPTPMPAAAAAFVRRRDRHRLRHLELRVAAHVAHHVHADALCPASSAARRAAKDSPPRSCRAPDPAPRTPASAAGDLVAELRPDSRPCPGTARCFARTRRSCARRWCCGAGLPDVGDR